VWVNLETVVAEPGVGRAAVKEFVFLSPPETVGILRAAGVDGVSLANNHLFDYGREGLLRTMELLDQGSLPRTGGGRDRAEAYGARRVIVDGRRVAVLGFYHMNNDYPWGAQDGVAGLASAWGAREDETVAAVEAARQGSDAVVVMVHWGTEHVHCPDRWQRLLARRWVHAGASMVIGSHPHVLQGVERIGNAWVLYSTGNFVFAIGQGPGSRTAFFEVTAGASAGLVARPVELHRGVPMPAGATEGRRILADLSSRSRNWTFGDDGRAVPTTVTGECPWATLPD
jgi:poly-gamma-glutamate synthesis protein (capsule biosynthesis protein)